MDYPNWNMDFNKYSHLHFKITSYTSEHLPRGRLQCFPWNSGALSTSKYHELMYWLYIHRIDIAVITETHWCFEDEWSTKHWHAMHSGHCSPATHDRSAGVLILVSKQLCEASQIAWTSPHPGRLVHCRVHLHTRPLDLIGVYQYVWNGSTMQTQRRAQFGQLTRTTLNALPNRNTLCVMGDFNCSLGAIPRLVGTDVYTDNAGQRMRGPQHGDSNLLHQLVKDMQFVGQNTWNSKNGPTFQNTLGRSSRIDYIFTRLITADCMAKQVGYLANAPFLQDGARHTPLLVGLCYKIYQRCRRTDLFTAHLKQQCIIDSREDTLKWQSCMNHINQTLRHANVHDLDTVTKIMTAGALQACQQKNLPSRAGLCSLKNKWEHFRQVRIPSPATLQNVFHEWHQHTLFRKFDKKHIQIVRQHRQRKVELMLEEAQQAHRKHDAYQLFRIINRHCPKRRLKRIHLKDSSGHFMSPTEETAAYESYIQRVWDGPILNVPDLPPPGVPFTEQQLENAIAGVPTTKAVAPIFAPGAAWRNQSHFLAPMIYELLQTWWTMTPTHSSNLERWMDSLSPQAQQSSHEG